MIGMTFDTALCGFMLITMGAITFLWFREIIRVRRLEWELHRTRLFHCRNCHLSFLNREDDMNMTRCPRCNTVCLRRHR